jgi:AcrR family transcriptional regulator
VSRISERRRQEILQAATAEFTARGISGASMSEIADRAGIGKSTIYEYFPSKTELFSEVCKQKMLEVGESIRAVFAQDRPFRAQMLAYCAVLQETLEDVDMNAALTLLMNNPSIGELAKSAQRMRDFAVEQIAGALRRAQRAGEVDPKLDPEPVACCLAILPNPHLICNLRERGVEEPVEKLIDLAFRGIAAH